jgi:hypothetical protein
METQTMSPSKTSLWAARILSTLVVLFLVMDGVMKLFKPAFVVAATIKLGYPGATIVGIGATLLVCTLLYVIPQTAVLGAILITGYLGGAVASNVRVGNQLFNTLFPAVIACLVWAGLWLRHEVLRRLLPLVVAQ